MKTWHLKFASYKKPDDIFNLIVNGKKTIETRSRNPEDCDNDYSNIQIGYKLQFRSIASGRTIEKEVIFVHSYKSVEEMAEKEYYENVFPGISSKENLINFYEVAKKKWGKKYKHELENYGIVAIGFK